MTVSVRTHHPENPLGKAVELAGGMTVSDALARAEDYVEEMREDCMAGLDRKIAEIEAAAGAAAFASTAADIQSVYRLSNEILNEAGVFGLSELSEAGRSLCDLTGAGIKVDERAIAVHVAAMKSLRRPDVEGDPTVRAAVLEGLRKVAAKASAKA